jgi:hypothetical protein
MAHSDRMDLVCVSACMLACVRTHFTPQCLDAYTYIWIYILHVRECTCICMYIQLLQIPIYMHAHIHIHIRRHRHRHTHIHIHMQILYRNMYMYIYIYMYVCLCSNIYMWHMHIHMHTHVYVRTDVHTNSHTICYIYYQTFSDMFLTKHTKHTYSFLHGSVYSATVNLFADLHMLFTAEHVVVTLSSNIGRIVGKLRSVYGLSEPISLDDQGYLD